MEKRELFEVVNLCLKNTKQISKHIARRSICQRRMPVNQLQLTHFKTKLKGTRAHTINDRLAQIYLMYIVINFQENTESR